MTDPPNATCALCGHEAASVGQLAKDYAIDLIRRDHPEWVREDGACPKCLAYYATLENVVDVSDEMSLLLEGRVPVDWELVRGGEGPYIQAKGG